MEYERRPLTIKVGHLIQKVLANHHFCLVNLKAGYGKTFMSINAIGEIDPTACLFVITTSKQIDEQHWQKSVDAYNRAEKTDLQLIAMNYEKLIDPNNDNELRQSYAQELHQKRLEGRNITMILDECHHAKNPTGKQTKIINKCIPACNKIIGLSATPIGNHAEDLIEYFILDGLVPNKSQFISRWCALPLDRYYHMQEKRIYPKADQIIQTGLLDKSGKVLDWDTTFNNGQWLHGYYNDFSISLDNVDALPPLKALTVKTKMTDDELDALIQMKNDYEDGVYENIGQYRADQFRFVGSCIKSKDQELLNILKSKKRPQTPVLVFYTMQETLEHLKKIIPDDFNVFAVCGGMKKSERQSLSEFIEQKDSNNVILIQYVAGGEGLNIPNSRISIFYEATTMSIKFIQAQGRNRRTGYNDEVTQIRFLTPNTIEEETYHKVIEPSAYFSSTLESQIMFETNRKLSELAKERRQAKVDKAVEKIDNFNREHGREILKDVIKHIDERTKKL